MTVVFKTPAEYGEEIQGVMDIDEDTLIVEFEKPKWFGKPQLIEVSIPIDDIEYAEYRNGLWGGKVRVRTLYLHNTHELPWAKALDVDFVVPRRERMRAVSLVASIEHSIERADQEQD